MKDSVVNEQSEVRKRRNVMVAKENEPTTITWALKRLCFIFSAPLKRVGGALGGKERVIAVVLVWGLVWLLNIMWLYGKGFNPMPVGFFI